MSKNYYDSDDLKKFGNITEWSPEIGDNFFKYYNSVFEKGALPVKEKALIALSVAHVVQCPYCIEAYTEESIKNGAEKDEMMEAVHVGAAIKAGSALVHGVQMMNKGNKIIM